MPTWMMTDFVHDIYVFIHSVMLEALADGGVMMGLPRDVATELAAQGTNSQSTY